MADDELIRASKNGDQKAFRQLVERYETRVAATVIGMLGDCPEADEVGQEVFVRFYKSLSKFRGEASLGTYLTRIAINLSLNELKRRQRKSWRFFSQSADEMIDLPDPQFNTAAFDNQELIHIALQKLEPNFRIVIILRLVEGFSTKETADLLKVPPGTVLSRLARGQQKMREILENMGFWN